MEINHNNSAVHSHNIQWTDDRKLALYVYLPTEWTWDDLYNVQNNIKNHLNTIDHTVDLLYDLSTTNTLPDDYHNQWESAFSKLPGNLGMILLIGCNTSTKTSVCDATRSNQELAQWFAFIQTLDEAHQFIDA